MPLLNLTSIDNDAALVKLIGELRSAIKAGNLTTGLAKTFSDKIEETIIAHDLGVDPRGGVMVISEYVKSVATVASRLNERLLYAGLTLMCRDIAMDPAKASEQKSELGTLITEFMDEQRQQFDILNKEEIEYQTNGLSGKSFKIGVYSGEISSLLMDSSICHEWMQIPGERIFNLFKEKFKEVICEGDNSVYAKIQKSEGSDAIQAIVTVLLTKCFNNTLWVPILTYFAILLLKTGIKMYCETEKAPE